ncbi:MAG: carboxypeptidase regulatory-like domain-containing protein [Deltaproteobacteria bacterium]|nr:carboxypeptidase regulatory-like domain-containing protein [Deltaproteobacteria bacterium]
MKKLLLALAPLLLAPSLASAQPQVVWKDAATPAFDLLTAVALVDDGTSGDQSAGDGLYSLDLSLPADAAAPTAPRTLHYVVVPPGGDLTSAVGAAGGGPMVLALPDGGARVVRIFYGTEADPLEPLTATCTDPATILSCKGYGPIPGVADDWNLQGGFGVVGDLQAHFGGTPWSANSPATSLGAVDPVDTLDLVAAIPLTGGLRIASDPGTLSLGADGWDFSGTLNTGTPYTVDTPAFTRTRIEARLQRGMARVVALPGAVQPPLLTELSLDSAAPFVELHNPSPAPLSLSGIHLGDDGAYLDLGASPTAATPGDFLVRFPAGAALAPGAFASVAFIDAATFSTVHGVAPDFVFSSLPASFTGSIDASAALELVGESFFLFLWQPGDELVVDLDLLVWGAPAAGDEAPDKSGHTVGASTYGTDAMGVNTTPAPADTTIERIDFLESGEARDPAANGVTEPGGERHDETSEPLDTTWQAAAAPTPGAPPPGFSFSVSGIVRDASSGAPLEGAVITATPGGDTATTDASGFYRLPLPDGSYTLAAELWHYVDGGAALTLAGGHQTQDFDLAWIPGVRLAGRVDRADGRPLADARVRLLTSPDLVRMDEVLTATDGTFEFLDVPQGVEVRVSAIKDGFTSRGITLSPSTDVTDIVLVLSPIPVGYAVSGHIEDATTGQALGGARVEIDALGAVATADAAGDFVLTLVPPGDHELQAGATDYAPQTIVLTVVDADVVLPPIQLVQASNALVLRGQITVSGLGVPVSDAEITLASTTGGATQVTHSNALGNYVFGGVAAGTYAFSVSAAGYATHQESALEVRVTTTHDVELSPEGGQGFVLSGVVQLSDESTGSWSGSRVDIEGPGTSGRDNTNGAGEFSFDGLQPGIYRLTASHNGYESASLELAVANDASQSFILQRNEEKPGVLASCLGCGQAGDPRARRTSWLMVALFGLILPLFRRR